MTHEEASSEASRKAKAMSEREPSKEAMEKARTMFMRVPAPGMGALPHTPTVQEVALALDDFAAQAVKEERERAVKESRKFARGMREANDAPK